MKIIALNASTLPVYCRELSNILLDVLADGALGGYQQSISREEAESAFYRLRDALSNQETLIWIARDESGVVGYARLDLCADADGLNRAEIKGVMVHRRARRLGAGKKLIQAVEEAASQSRRGLLYLDVQAGTPAEAFWRATGYRCLGEMPDYVCSADGYCHSAVIYYKRLFAVNPYPRAVAN
ncbi:GNAT family N-acetyltransferase [Atlantibacter sp.]|uniref:GNAT family N-acetyltransferase n=1 Tax=Atlantibacter sp. TaxID=1903473 RepID=UPI0028A91506|nr:GNAT family N-acetyltransferase [Atlantibacter sp.]